MNKNPKSKPFLRNMDLEDILNLIHEDLQMLAGVGSTAGSLRRYETTDITALDGEVLDALRCGDQVVKRTGNQRHVYVVSYKGEGVGEGLCLTYADASTVETVSYDRTVSGWSYNSTDKGVIPADGENGEEEPQTPVDEGLDPAEPDPEPTEEQLPAESEPSVPSVDDDEQPTDVEE